MNENGYPRAPRNPHRDDRRGGSNTLRVPKKPQGHQAALTRMKGRATILINLMSSESPITGTLIDSDRYTITVGTRQSLDGDGQHEVFFKHDISSYILTPTPESAGNV